MRRLIDANKLIQKLTSGCFPQDAAFGRGISFAKEIVDNMPTEDSTNHSHWISYQDQTSFGLINKIRCFNCGHDKVKSSYGDPKYCEECGFRMDEENEA